MLNCYFWLVTLFALAVTNGQVKLGKSVNFKISKTNDLITTFPLKLI